MNKADFLVDGKSCGGCIRRVSRALNPLPEVAGETVAAGLVRVRQDPAVTPELRVAEAIQNAGYPARKQQTR